MFNLFDKDQDLEIGSNDLEMLFEPVGWNNKVDVDRILKAMDLNKDGRVCFEGKNHIKSETGFKKAK